MSAGPNAKPLGKEGWLDKNGKEIAEKDFVGWGFTCEYGCGYKGTMDELLGEDDNDTLYCPQCGTAGWIWD